MAGEGIHIPLRSFKWEMRNFTLPEGDLWQLAHIEPLQLRNRFLELEKNRQAIVYEKMKSCLTNILVNYLDEAERNNFFTADYRKRLLGNFKSSRQWREHIPETRVAYQPMQATTGGPFKPLVKALKLPFAHRLPGNPSDRSMFEHARFFQNTGGQIRERPSVHGMSRRPTSPTEFKPWKTPEAPSLPLTEMTFWRFFDIFCEANGIKYVDIAADHMPWDEILSHFESYIQAHWPENSDAVNLRHISTALQKTKLREYIPQSSLERLYRHLAMLTRDDQGKSRENEAPQLKLNPLCDQAKKTDPGREVVNASHTKQSLLLRFGSGPPQGGEGSSKRPSETAEEHVTNSPKRLRPNGTTLRQSVLTTDEGREDGSSIKHLNQEEKSLLSKAIISTEKDGTLYPEPVTSQLGEMVTHLATRMPSPVPSATSWLYANIPNGLDKVQLGTPAPAPTNDNVAREPASVAPNKQDKILSIPDSLQPPVLVTDDSPYETSARLVTILQSSLHELEDFLRSSNGACATKLLTAEQQYAVGHIIKTQRRALKELLVLQALMRDA